jgi:hypothetical protein
MLGLAAGRQIVIKTTPGQGVSRLSGQARRQDQGGLGRSFVAFQG